jgi:hypothetical protein
MHVTIRHKPASLFFTDICRRPKSLRAAGNSSGHSTGEAWSVPVIQLDRGSVKQLPRDGRMEL